MLSWKPVMMLVLIAMTTVMTKISAYVRTNTQNEDVALDSCGQLDIAFIIDSSGSINDADPSNWRTLLQFMADLINGGAFMVGQDGVRFAVVKYSTTAYVEFSLDAYNDNSSLTERILASKYIGGRTNIAAALEMTRTSVFRQQNGDRNHVPNVAILVTDGIPNEQEQDTLMEANLLKANNTDHETLVITVGITDAVDVDQLKNISTNNQILYVSNFTRLNLLIDTISTATCKARTITVEYCTNPVDLIFIVDSSGSVGQSNWPQVLNFCSLVVNKLKTGKDDVRVGMLSYGNSAYRQFDLNSYTTKEAIMDNIRNITYKNEMTNTSGAIRYATDIMFKAASGDRPGVTNVAIVITDGEANRDANLTTPEAIRARSKGIHVIAIGIGEQIGNKELRGIGGDNVYRVRGFDVMADITDAIVDETCDLTAACTAKNDVLFVLDSSGSVSFDNFETMKNSVAGAVQSMVSENGTRVGIVTFSTTATVHMYTDQYGNGSEQAEAIRRIQYLPGTTNTAEALRTARDVVFGGNRDRHDVRDILVLLTDGGSNDFAATLHESVLTKLAGIHVIVVGVTSWVNAAEVNAIATSPVGKNAIMAKDFDVINASMMKVRKLICSDIDPCTTSFCQNGGTCKQRAGEAICLCTPGHAGDRCQYGCSERADVVIMIDSSSSVTSRRYYEMLEVVRQLVKQLPMYRDMVRTAVITFSSQAKLRLTMRDMKNKTAVEESIMFSYIGGTTNTAAALNMMQDDVFDVPSDRPYIRNVALLLTDGQSNDRSATFAAAARCHHQGTHIIAAGINMMTQYQQRELRSIASDPDTSSLVNIASFEELRDKGKDIILPAFLEAVCNNIDECETNRCENGATCVDGIFSHDCICPKGYSGRYCEKRCSDKLDIVFAVDVSGSIRRSRLEIIKYFISMIILDFDVSERHTRIGLLTFSDTAHVVSHLNTYTSKEDIMQAVDLLPYTMGRTNIADALVTMRNMFSELHGDRLDAPDIGVIITDGIPTVNLDKTVPEAIQNRLLGIHLMVVVAESDPEYLLFKSIATDPDERNIFSAPKFGDLMVLHESVRKAMCNDVDECLSNPCQNGGKCIDLLGRRVCLCPDQYTGENCERTCRRRYDVTFVLDASGSPNKNFEHAQRLAKQVVLGLNFNGGRTRVAMVTYGDVATVRFRLDAYTSQLEVLNAIAFDDEKGRTNTASGLRAAETQVLVTGNGDRAGDANIVIVATDGYSNLDPEQTRQEAAAITRGGSRIIVVAVGSNVNHKEINNIASDPDTENVVLMPDPDSVMSAADAVLRLLCD